MSTNAARTPGQAIGSSMRARVAGPDSPLTHAASRISWGMVANACCIGSTANGRLKIIEATTRPGTLNASTSPVSRSNTPPIIASGLKAVSR